MTPQWLEPSCGSLEYQSLKEQKLEIVELEKGEC